MLLTLFLPALILIPFFAYRIARHKTPQYKFCIAGASFGTIVSPFGMGLYSWFFLSPWALVPGVLGLVLTLIHGSPGFQLAIKFGLARGIEVASSTTQQLIIEIINAVVWSIVYGLLGYAVDFFRNQKRNRQTIN